MTTVHDTPDLAAVRDALVAADRVVITCHLRPDGDAIGTEVAIARALQSLGKTVTILNADRVPRNLDWLADEQPTGLMQVYESGDFAQAEAVSQADVLLVCDANAEHRLGDVGGVFRKAGKPVLLLDHHPDPETWFDLACVRTDASAAAEIAYDLIAGIDPDLIDRAVATALYVGIMTDTGSFRYGATTPRTHAIVADILERGDLKSEPIHVALFDGRSREGLALLSLALTTIRTHYGGRLATLFVTQDMIRQSGAFFDETEGLINYGLSLDGVLAAVIALELPSGVKLSFRSKGDCPINKWAGQFGGGGHPNASGAFVKGGQLARTIKDVVDAAPPHVAADPDAVAESEGSLSDADLALLAQFKGGLD
ncbi:DHH family phosphoesterase [Rubrivirga sp. IMCC45206]|uniref:DHH family phosphoesterase n=1 Tax=Rubrivirga sp. IMCC45206 TaxID=3391614 RepID=UPI00398F8EDC